MAENSTVTNNIEQIQNYLNLHYEFIYNSHTNRLQYRLRGDAPEPFEYLTDYEFNSILKAIKQENISCAKDTLRIILYSDFVSSFNPYSHYLDSLPEWDGVDYIAQLASSVETTEPEHWNLCLKKWLVALVGSLLDETVVNHTAIIFSGEQGIGKTTWFRSIIPKEWSEFIFEGYVATKDKETLVKISECVLIVMDELENLSSKNIDALKQLMTQEKIYLRRAYTTMSQNYTRRASFAGTVNKKEFLHDLTGNRRFLCFETQRINYAHDIPIQNLYSQLVYLYRNGFQYWFDKEETVLLNEKNQQFRAVAVEEDILCRFYKPCSISEATDFLSTTALQQDLIQKSGFSTLSIQSLGHVLRGMKFERTKRNGAYVYAVKEIIN